MQLDPNLVADLDDDTLLMSLDAASADDRMILMAEVEKRRLSI